MKRTKWTKWAAIAGVAVLLTSGCSLLDSEEEGREIDPPPQNVSDLSGSAKDAIPSSASVQQQGVQVTLYMKDRNGFVAPVTVQIPTTQAVARKTLEHMVEDGPGEALVPADFQAILPKGTKIIGLNIDQEKKIATVDFSKEFNQYNVQDERKIVEAVTWALTGFPNVNEVQIWVEGKMLKEMPQGGLPIDGALSRAIGINLERAEGTEFGQTTPVTLYFLAQTENQTKYYVPVTRMVKRTEDKAKATLEQLIAGPTQKSNLASVLAPTVDVPNIETADGTITVNFSEQLLGPDRKAPSEAIQAIVLSLTETAGSAKVQIKVNGDAKVSTTDNQTINKPVTRPSHVNQIKL